MWKPQCNLSFYLSRRIGLPPVGILVPSSARHSLSRTSYHPRQEKTALDTPALQVAPDRLLHRGGVNGNTGTRSVAHRSSRWTSDDRPAGRLPTFDATPPRAPTIFRAIAPRVDRPSARPRSLPRRRSRRCARGPRVETSSAPMREMGSAGFLPSALPEAWLRRTAADSRCCCPHAPPTFSE